MTHEQYDGKDAAELIEDLRSRLAQAEEALRAIHSGEAGAQVIPETKHSEQLTVASKELLAINEELQREIEYRNKAEDALRESESNYRELVQNANSAIIRWNRDGVITFFNEYAQQLFGYSDGEAVGRSINMLLPKTDSTGADLTTLAADILNHPDNYANNINENITRDGRRIWMAWTNRPILDENGQISEILVVGNDITERRQVEEALRESEERLRLFIENAPASIAMFDREMRYIAVSRRWMIDYGLGDRNVIGLSHYELFPEITEEWKSVHQRGLTGELIVRDEDRFDRIDGTVQWLKWEVRPWHKADGSIGGIIIFTEDITVRKQDEQERELAIDFLHIVNQSTEIHDLVKAAATFFHEHSGCEAVGIRLKDGDDYPYYEVRGFPTEFVVLENSLCARDIYGEVVRDSDFNPVMECMCGNVILGRFDPTLPFFTENGSFWTNGTTQLLAGTTDADRQAHTRNRCNGEGYESVALIQLRAGGERLGLLQLNDRRKGLFSAGLIALWERLAGYLAVALAKLRAEEALRESEKRFRTLFESMDEGFYLAQIVNDESGMPVDYRYMEVNPAFERITGMNRGQLIGKTNAEAIPGISVAWMDVFKKVALTGEPTSYDFFSKTFNSYFETFAFIPEKGSFAVVVNDVTERKRAEEDRETTLQRFHNVLASTYAATLLVAEDGQFEFANQAFCDMFNIEGSPTALIGLNVQQMIDRISGAYENGDEAVARIAEIVRVGQPVKGEEIALKNGRTCIRDFIPLHVDGKPHGRLWQHMDITERKQAEEALARAKEEWERTFDTIPDLVAILDCEHHVVRANRSMAERLGVTIEEAVGATCYEVIHGTCQAPGFCPHAQTCQDGLQHITEVNEPTLGGDFMVSTTPMHDPDGNIIGSVHVAHDITARVRAEKELQSAFDREMSTSRMLQRALAPGELFVDESYPIASAYLPVFEGEEVGGDFYDVFATQDGNVAILLGDVSGKGVGAAAIGVFARSMIRALAYSNPSPGYALSQTNMVLENDKGHSGFVTVFLAILNPETGRIRYSNGGHPSTVVHHASGDVELLAAQNLPLGIMTGLEYADGEVHLEPGDRIILYTDGISESRRKDHLFGTEGIQKAVLEHAGEQPQVLVDALVTAANDWAEGRVTDDRAVIVMERQTPKPETPASPFEI